MNWKAWYVICMLTSLLNQEAQWEFPNQRQQILSPAQYLTMNLIQGKNPQLLFFF